MRFLIYTFLSLFILLGSTGAVFFLAQKEFISESSLPADVRVLIPRGSGFSKAVDILAENKIIANPYIFKFFAYSNGDAARVKAGEYLFTKNISPKSALQILVDGKVVIHKVTFPEGLNVREIVEILIKEQYLEGDVPENIEEGSLLPETYNFIYGDTRASIVKRMQEKMQQTLLELWEKRQKNLPIASKEQAIILASIVQKEIGAKDEMARVAGVFINRLKIGMRLQSDPTVVYGIEKATGKPMDRALLSLDLKIPTVYNTYTIESLPPTPIANPSRMAIEAVLNPLPTNELYFVATGSGGHNFAVTLDEHNKNVQKYREKNRQQQ